MAKTDADHRKYYPLSGLLLGNLLIAIWIGLGALVCALFYPLAALLFFGVAAFLVFYEVGKRGCVTCYYCKNCTIGMGKLPDLFFRRGGTANVNRRALRFFSVTYLLLSVLPAALMVVSLIQEVAIYKVALLAAILVFSVYTGVVRHQTLLGLPKKTLH
jgi:hypothetical protein